MATGGPIYYPNSSLQLPRDKVIYLTTPKPRVVLGLKFINVSYSVTRKNVFECTTRVAKFSLANHFFHYLFLRETGNLIERNI